MSLSGSRGSCPGSSGARTCWDWCHPALQHTAPVCASVPLADFELLQMLSFQAGQWKRNGFVYIGSAVNHCDGSLRRASSQGHKHTALGQHDIRGAPRPSTLLACSSTAPLHPTSTQQLITFFTTPTPPPPLFSSKS